MQRFVICLVVLAGCDRAKPVAPVPAPAPTPVAPAPVPHEHQDPIDEKSLAVQGVAEPEWPLLKGDEEIRKAGGSPMPGGGYHIEKKGVPSVIVPGKVLMTRGVIELLGCAEGGKEHESVLRLDCDIQALNLALVLSRFTGGAVPEKLGQEGKQGSRLLVLIQWKDGDKVVTYRAEDLVVNLKRKSTMPRVGWTYVGAFVEVENAVTPNAKEKQRVLAATGSRSLITTWRDPSTLLDNPLPDAVDDTAYAANHVVLPPSGTTVSVILRGPTKDEADAISGIEKELAK